MLFRLSCSFQLLQTNGIDISKMPKPNKIDLSSSFNSNNKPTKQKLIFQNSSTSSNSHNSSSTSSIHNPAFSRNPLKSPFCTDLRSAVEYDRKHLKEKTRQIPVILESMIKVMETHLNIEGIYRINGAASRMKKMQQIFIEKWRDQKEGWIRSIHYVSVWSQIDYEGGGNEQQITKQPTCKPHDVAGLIKRYLRELQDPLLSNMYSILFLTTDKITDLKQKIRAICLCFLLLTNVHKKTTLYVLQHLKRVCERHLDNKMTLTNVAVCLSPCFFSLTDESSELAGDQMKQATNIVKIMIRYVDILNVLPAEILRQTRKARESLNKMKEKQKKVGGRKKRSRKFNSILKHNKDSDTVSTYAAPIVNSVTLPTIAKIGMVPSSFTPPKINTEDNNNNNNKLNNSLADYNILQIQIDKSVHDFYQQSSNPRPNYSKNNNNSIIGGRTAVGMVFDEKTRVKDVIQHCVPIVGSPTKVCQERNDLNTNSMSRDSLKNNVNNDNLNLQNYALFEVGGNLTRRRLPNNVLVQNIRAVNPDASFLIKYEIMLNK